MTVTAPLSVSGVKVHVRVIGAVSTNSDDDDTTLHVLSEEESATFQNMIVAILVSMVQFPAVHQSISLSLCFSLWATSPPVRLFITVF